MINGFKGGQLWTRSEKANDNNRKSIDGNLFTHTIFRCPKCKWLLEFGWQNHNCPTPNIYYQPPTLRWVINKETLFFLIAITLIYLLLSSYADKLREKWVSWEALRIFFLLRWVNVNIARKTAPGVFSFGYFWLMIFGLIFSHRFDDVWFTKNQIILWESQEYIPKNSLFIPFPCICFSQVLGFFLFKNLMHKIEKNRKQNVKSFFE